MANLKLGEENVAATYFYIVPNIPSEVKSKQRKREIYIYRERVREREREIERDFYFFESASGRFEPTTPV